MRATEFTPGNKDLIIFDIDDTLMHTTAQIKVVKDGQVIRSLSNQEFNNYQLQPGEQFDFGEFRNAEKFRQESKPIVPMVRKLKTILTHAGNAKVIMLTARSDFDDKETFLQTFKDIGIDMSRVHVHRAGNIPGDEPPAYKKAVWVRKYLNTRQYGHVRLYDDSMSNLRVFKELKKEYPQVDFRAIYVGPGGTTQTVEGSLNEFAPGGNSSSSYYAVTSNFVKEFVQQKQEEIQDLIDAGWTKKDLEQAGTLKGNASDIAHFEQVRDSFLKGLKSGFDAYLRGDTQLKDQLGEYWIENDLPLNQDWEKIYGEPWGDDSEFNEGIEENFADGRNPQDKGDAKRHGINTKASVSSLRKTAKQGGRKGQLAHWLANMKAGRAKKK